MAELFAYTKSCRTMTEAHVLKWLANCAAEYTQQHSWLETNL